MRIIIWTALLAAVALGAGAQAAAPVAAIEPRGPVILHRAASPASDAIQMRIRVRNQRRHGNFIDISFRLEIEGAPGDKTYQLFLQDLGMKRQGLPPAPLYNDQARLRVDANGRLTPDIFSFELTDFSRGEWIQFTLRSTDGEISKTVRFVPYP